jgi:hypothetical protein
MITGHWHHTLGYNDHWSRAHDSGGPAGPPLAHMVLMQDTGSDHLETGYGGDEAMLIRVGTELICDEQLSSTEEFEYVALSSNGTIFYSELYRGKQAQLAHPLLNLHFVSIVLGCVCLAKSVSISSRFLSPPSYLSTTYGPHAQRRWATHDADARE